MDFKDYLREQGELHPAMEPQDVVKMVYQAAYGAEHLLADVEKAGEYLIQELEMVPADARIPLVEDISEDMCRVNLAAWKAKGLPADWLLKIFVLSAGGWKDRDDVFAAYLKQADEAVSGGWLDFTYDEWHAYIKEYMKDGVRAVHHSEGYRQAEKPAYRLAARCFVRILPVLEKAAALGTSARPSVIAIDGRAASGKTTMAGQLRLILGGSIIRMDDFFLPPELRTEERFSQPGGNVHYERFAEEVLPHIRDGREFTYRRFDCSSMDFDQKPVKVGAGHWRIVEGSYSHHPKLGDYADLRIFSDVDAETQMERIIVRNGHEMAEIFRSRWIPLEEEYFRTVNIAEKADMKV